MSTVSSGGPSRMGVHSGRWHSWPVVGGAALAGAVGVLTAVQGGAAAAVAAAVVLAAVLLSMRSLLPPVEMAGRRFRWASVAWAWLLTLPVGHFTSGRTSLSAVAGIPSIENVVNLTMSAAIATLAVWSLKRNRFVWRPSWLLLALPALAVLSAAWSLAPTVTLGFAFELVAMALLGTLTAAIVRADPRLGQSLVRRTLRYALVGLAVLCVIGLIFRSDWAPADVANGAPRFTWPGGHPLVAGAEAGLGILVIVFGGRRETRFSWLSCIVLLALFGVCLYLASARTALAGLAVSGLFGYWFASKGSGLAARIGGAAAIGAAIFVLVTSFGGPITQYVYRGQSQQRVYALNGRVGVWTFALQQLHSPGRWLAGYGLGGTRVLLASSFTWAADTHSAWLETLLSLGLVGVVIAAALVAMLAVRLFRGPPGSLTSRVLPILFVYILVMSPLGGGFAAPGPEPGFAFALLCLCYGATARHEPALSRAAARPRRRLEADLRPAPI
jgi:hypothetical protein